jgi:two-component system sensor histidine kinase KdpD
MRSPISERWASALADSAAIWQVLLSCLTLGVVTFLGFELQVGLTTISCAYLLLVFAAALLFGFWQASLVSILAAACIDYFFAPPLFHFSISDPQDWISLATFEAFALLISRLSTKEHQSSSEAFLHRTSMEQLYELSRSSLLLDLRQPPGVQLVILIQRIFKLEGVVIYDANLLRQDVSGEWSEAQSNIAKECYFKGAPLDDLSSHTLARVLRGSTGLVGGIALRGMINPLAPDALAQLAALVIDRYQSFEKEELAETARKSEQLRAAVMDALAHEFKTPLSTVHTATSGLFEFGGLNNTQSDFVTIIDQQTSRMIALCTKLLLTAKLESGRMPLASNQVNVRNLIEELIAGLAKGGETTRILFSVEETATFVYADRGLLAMILSQYIDNAYKYSTPNTPIEIVVRKSYNEALFSVHNVGPGIPLEDREQIFDRFYRSRSHVDSVPGTGIGLSVMTGPAGQGIGLNFLC